MKDADASMASTIASTMQQMSMSFGIAAASLVTAMFIPDRFHAEPAQMIHGIHLAFLVLGGLTVLSTAVFAGLHADDGSSVSKHQQAAAAGASEAVDRIAGMRGAARPARRLFRRAR